MQGPPDSTTPCPEGFDDERIAALIDDPEDDAAFRHLAACEVCAERYFDHAVIAMGTRTLAGIAAAKSLRKNWRSTLGFRFPRIPVAAAILVAAMGVAVAGVMIFRRPIILSSAGLGLGRVADIERRTGLALSEARLPAEAVIQGWTMHILNKRQTGTVVCADVGGEHRMEVAGFGPHGEPRWSSSGMKWPDLPGASPLYFRGMGTVVSRNSSAGVEERLWLVVDRYSVGGLFLADPITGACTGRYLHQGPLAQAMVDAPAIYVLPAAPGEPRRLLVSGHHNEVRPPVLCVSVLESDATPVQHITFPSLGASGIRGPTEIRIDVDWAPGHHTVAIQALEGIIFTLPFANGRLDTSNVTVRLADRAADAFEEANRATGMRFETWLADQGGSEAVLTQLARHVREVAAHSEESLRVR